MAHKYTAKIYCGTDEIIKQSGDNVEELYLWMLAHAESIIGEVKGEIMDEGCNIIKQFKKRAIE